MGVFQNSLMGGAASISGDETYTLWSWGTHNNGSSGLGNNTAYSSPVQIGSLNDWTPVVTSDGGSTHAIKQDGTLWGWGALRKLGDGTSVSICSPVQVGDKDDWYAIFCGATREQHWAINTSGEMWCWGYNAEGSLGLGNRTNYSSMVQVAGTTWAAVGSGQEHTIAVRTDGTLWGWGSGQFGRSMHGDETTYSSPVQCGSDTDWWASSDYPPSGGWESGVEAQRVFGQHCGKWHSNVIKAGELWGAGFNALGNIGVDGYNVAPQQAGSSTNWTSLDYGDYGGNGIDDGVYKNWGGYNTAGELGNGGKSNQSSGTLYEWDTGTATSNSWTTAGSTYSRTFANFGGTIFGCGDATQGQSGNGTTTSTCSPIQGPGTTDWTKLVCGEYSIIGIKPG